MTGGTTIRKLEGPDFAILRHLRLEALQTESASFDSTYEDALKFSDQDWRNWVNTDFVFAAFDGATPVALMGFERHYSRKCQHRATLGLVFVTKDYRGTGLSDLMLRHVEDHARNVGITQFELDLSSNNPAALKLYQRNGFKEFGRTPNAVVENGEAEDDILMWKSL